MKRIGKNKFIQRIMSEVSDTDPYAAILKLVGRHRKPGDTLGRVAEKLGVHGITVTRMGFDGGIFEDASGLRIKLNSESPVTRRRFTLAHEIAHLIIASGSARGARRSHAGTELERACDVVAAELLLPFEEIRHSAPTEASTAGLLALADEFGVSPHATAVRLSELGLWTESIGQWSWDGKARELWFVGKRLWPERTIWLSTLELAVRRGYATAWEVVECQERGAFPVFLEVRRLGRERVYLIAVLRDTVKRGLDQGDPS